MARLDPIPARQHFAAIATLRWQLFRNGFRRKGATGELVARILLFPIIALFLLGAIFGAGAGGYFAVRQNTLPALAVVYWAIFAFQLFTSINFGQPGLSFTPESLLRFPLSLTRYLAIRLALGLLAVANIVGAVALLSAATGITLARPSLAFAAYAVAILLALGNMLFLRMVFAWVDRWLSTRRARELLTGFIVLFSIGIQYLNVTFNGLGKHVSHAEQARKFAVAARLYGHAEPLLSHLPPGLATRAIVHAAAHHPAAIALDLLGLLAFAALFFAIFAWRIAYEYRGENLSDAANVSSRALTAAPAAQHPHAAPAITPATAQANPLPALLAREFIYIRRNPTQLYGLLTPLAMVFLFAARMGSLSRTGYVFPLAMAYSFLGVATLSYNIFGLDAQGIQFYFLAPVSFRTVVLSKNLFTFAVTAVQILLVYLLLLFTAGRPPLALTLATIAWVLFASFVNVTVGNLRSITAPKKLDPGKLSRGQASQLSALLSVGITLALAALGAGSLLLARSLTLPWLPIAILLTLAAIAAVVYRAALSRIPTVALDHRETLIAELSKT